MYLQAYISTGLCMYRSVNLQTYISTGICIYRFVYLQAYTGCRASSVLQKEIAENFKATIFIYDNNFPRTLVILEAL